MTEKEPSNQGIWGKVQGKERREGEKEEKSLPSKTLSLAQNHYLSGGVGQGVDCRSGNFDFSRVRGVRSQDL